MATTNVSTKFRPVKIGFLVREGQVEDILEVLEISPFLVGGTHNLIIPISEQNKDQIEEVIKNSDIDILHPIYKGGTVNEMMGKFPYLQAPRNFSDELLHEDWHTKKNNFRYLDVFNTIIRNNEKHFRGTPQKKKSNATYITWASSDNLKDWLLLSFGSYDETKYKLNDPFKEAFIKGLRANKIKILRGKNIPKSISGAITPAIFSAVDLKSHRQNHLNPGVYVGDEKNFEDLVNFWNLRALGTHLVFLPISNNSRLIEFIQEELNEMEKYLSRSAGMLHNITLYHSSSRKTEDMESLLSLFKLARKPFFKVVNFEGLVNHFNDLQSDHFNSEFSQTNLENENGQITATVNLPEKKFIPNDSERNVNDQILAVSINAFSESYSNGYFLNPPNVKTLNEFYSREIAFDPWTIRVEKEGITAIIKLDEKYLRLRPIEQGKIIEKFLEDSEIKSELSQAGLLAQKIINKLGSLEAARVFKIGGVRNLFDELKSKSAITRSGANQKIHQDRAFEKHKGLYIEGRTEKDLTVKMVFDFLLKKDFLRAGLELYCKNCNLENWLNLKAIDDEWICEYCGNKNLTSPDLKDRGDWKFRKSGLFAKDNNQEGSIPVILTLLVLNRILTDGFAFSTSLKLNLSGKETETDFCVIQYKQKRWGDNKIEVVIGECKSHGGTITEQDCNNLKLVASELKQRGYKPFITFSKTADAFAEDELELFKALRKEGWDLILLTNKEIEPYNPYPYRDEAEKLPYASVINLKEASINSIVRYKIDTGPIQLE